ncbi:MAG: FliM/FliN family flagellar motor switch protein [Bryobacteraceae bacterium]|nr:FliM/FliN family flagellar motor switch protein [Bryobacterales bacterium]MEB2361096.1 FliM/FliN family flagellar motor switch protein [Bryobacterales bacterium]NUM99831.1 FliM/FliN family flagellar motor switch protein [Bryobacteraceae bacterium]
MPAPLEEISAMVDVPMEVSVELDRKIMTIFDILSLETGSVIRLNRSAGENLDLLIGGAVTAYGEIVIIEDTMGVRITDFAGEE